MTLSPTLICAVRRPLICAATGPDLRGRGQLARRPAPCCTAPPTRSPSPGKGPAASRKHWPHPSYSCPLSSACLHTAQPAARARQTPSEPSVRALETGQRRSLQYLEVRAPLLRSEE